jgi:VanZ family protein
MASSFRQSPRFWAICFVLWFIVLNFLSHGNRFDQQEIIFDIPHFDKIVHFGYFFGGGGLLSAAFFLRSKPSWKRLIIIVTVSLSLIGIWDEFHQSFFENRTGNDPGDWLADTLGAFCGALVFKKMHRRLL